MTLAVSKYLPRRWWLFIGYAALLAWLRVLYNSPLLSGGVSHMGLHVWSMAAIAVCALALALFAGKTLKRRAQGSLTIAACILGCAGTAGVMAGSLAVPSVFLQVTGYVLCSCAAVWFALGWQVSMARGGIRSAMLLLVATSVVGGALFFSIMCLPQTLARAVAVTLPALVGALLAAVQGEARFLKGQETRPATPEDTDCRQAPPQEREQRAAEPAAIAEDYASYVTDPTQRPFRASQHWMTSAPYRLLVIVALTSFINGLVRTSGDLANISFASSTDWLSFGFSSILATAVGAAVAFFAQSRRISLAFDIALPTMAAGCIAFASLPEPVAFAGQMLVAAGAQVVYVLAWVLLINTAVTYNRPPNGVFALLLCFQYTGLFFGQGASSLVAPTTSSVAYLSLFLLVLVSIAMADMHSRLVVSKQALEGQPVPSFVERAAQLAKAHGLTPRETQVFELWVTGHAGSYLESELGITKNTLKTHLGHIYEKTGTSNREELISLVERSI